jgi:hypothetical protein
LDWFGGFGYQIPFGVSVADFILDISLGEAGYSNSGATGNAAVKELYRAFETQYGGAASAGNAAMQAGGFSSSIKQQQKMLPISTIHSAGDVSGMERTQQAGVLSTEKQQQQPARKGGRDRAPYWEQLRVLLQRTARVRRFEQMTGQHFFQLFAVAFITGRDTVSTLPVVLLVHYCKELCSLAAAWHVILWCAIAHHLHCMKIFVCLCAVQQAVGCGLSNSF